MSQKVAPFFNIFTHNEPMQLKSFLIVAVVQPYSYRTSILVHLSEYLNELYHFYFTTIQRPLKF